MCGSGPDDWLGRVTAYRAVTSFENLDALPCGLVRVDENYVASARKARGVLLQESLAVAETKTYPSRPRIVNGFDA